MNTTIRLFYSCQLFLFLCILPSIGLAQFGGKERMYEGFVSLNEGLEQTRVITAKFSERLYYNLTLLHQNNELKVADGLRIGMQIRDSVSSLMHYLNEMKLLLIVKCENKTRTEIEALDTLISLKHLNNYDDYITPETILFGENEANLRRGQFSAFHLVNTADRFIAFSDSLLTSANLSVPDSYLFEYITDYEWLRSNIRHKPLAAIIALLSKLQLDIKLQEQVVISNIIDKG